MKHYFQFNPPFNFPPRGETVFILSPVYNGFLIPSPVGEGQDGGLNVCKMKSWSITEFVTSIVKCYIAIGKTKF